MPESIAIIKSILTPNQSVMSTLHLIKEIYIEGFRNLGNLVVKNYFKVFAWFSFVMYAVGVYAFMFRVSTGFAFQ